MNESKLWYLENFSMFSTLSKQEMEMMDKSLQMRNAEKSQILYFPEDTSKTIYLLKKGKVKISKISAEGKEIILNILNPGEIFGEMALTQDSSRNEIAEVTEDAVICVADIEDMKQVMRNNPEFNFQITKFIGFRLKKIQTRLESLLFKTAEERVMQFIKDMADEYGKQVLGNPNEFLIKLKLTHDEISKLTATSRQTVSTVLKQAEKDEIITYDRKSIFVKRYDLM